MSPMSPPENSSSPAVPTEGVSTTVPTEGVSTTVPAEGVSTTVPTEGVSTTVPVELYARLLSLRPILCRRGAVLKRFEATKPTWRVRYMDQTADRRVQRSVCLGSDEAVVAAVKGLLQTWRNEADQPRLQAVAARKKALLERKEQVAFIRLAKILAGGGWRRQRQIKRWCEKLYEDRWEQLRFIVTGEFPKPLKAGRPKKIRLW